MTNSTAAITLKICTRFDVSTEPLVGQRLLTMFVYVNGRWPIRVPSCGGRRRAPLGKHQGSNHGRGLQALLRAAVSHQVAVARLRAIFATQVMPALAPLWRDRAAAATRVGLVATQMLGMALCRYVLRLPPVVALDRAAVIRWLGPTIQRYLTTSG